MCWARAALSCMIHRTAAGTPPSHHTHTSKTQQRMSGTILREASITTIKTCLPAYL